MSRLTLCMAIAAASACSGASEYSCPDPIGRIILDECEAYKTKYEALKVELGASIGPLGGKVALGQQSLRDPSELLQVLAHRTFALCRDFNACRVMPLEYRQRREQTDCIFTAVSAIQAQLNQSLDAESKGKLVKELVRVLGGETCGGPIASSAISSSSSSSSSSTSSTSSSSSSSSSAKRTYYYSSTPWFGTRLLPPQPSSPSGVPRLVSADFGVDHVFRQKSPYGVTGYRPRVTLELEGKSSADDMVTVDWGGESSDCTIRGGRNDLAVARCKAPKSLTLTGSSFSVKLAYRRGADGKSFSLGRRTVRVLIRREERTKNDSHRYGINHDAEADQGLLVFRPNGRHLPPDFERPHLYIVLLLRKYSSMQETARCWVDGKPVTRAVEGRQGHVAQYQDRPRYRETGPGSSVGVSDPFLHWRSVDFQLPFVVQRDRAVKLDKGDQRWPRAGNWRCVATVDGEPVRELRFQVKPDGTLVPHPRQKQRARAEWLLETRVLPNPVESKLEGG